HHRLLVPAEDGARARQVADLREAAAQLLEGRSHGEEPYSTLRRIWLANSVAKPSDVARYSRRGGSMLVRRRIQTPSVANGPERGSTEGEVVLGASPPARPLLARAGGAQLSARRRSVAMRWCAAAFVIGGRHLAASSASESDGCFTRSRAISSSRRGNLSTSSSRIAASCSRAACTVRLTFASSAFASRFAC